MQTFTTIGPVIDSSFNDNRATYCKRRLRNGGNNIRKFYRIKKPYTKMLRCIKPCILNTVKYFRTPG